MLRYSFLYLQGRLLYCEPPPGTNPVKFNTQLNISSNNITSHDQHGITDLKEPKVHLHVFFIFE